MKMIEKEGKKTLYVRIKKSNKDWVKLTAKKLGYKSESEFVDKTFDKIKGKKT